METIKKWQDVEKFAGKLVAFETGSTYIGFGSDKNGNGEYIGFAIVDGYAVEWTRGGLAYGMTKIYKKGQVPGNCCLSQKEISNGLKMRLVSSAEFEQIKKDINSGECFTGYGEELPVQ